MQLGAECPTFGVRIGHRFTACCFAFDLIDALAEQLQGLGRAAYRETQSVGLVMDLLCQPRWLGLGSTK
jgi:hypothetical protein